jgi:15-cis-phytoene synthase
VSVSAQITRRAKSNLAFALKILPKDRREDMMVFYAFCRTMDDLADSPGLPAAGRARALDLWEKGLFDGFEKASPLQKEVLALRERQKIPTELLVSMIDGCKMDLKPQRFETWEALAAYIWKVACSVGLVSIRIFGCKDPGSEHYAETLGKALQLTNILRDLGEDLANGKRIYLPLEDLAKFEYTEQNLTDRIYNEKFVALMNFQADRAEGFFREAAAALPLADQRALLPAKIMSEIYWTLLKKMRANRFRVFQKHYRISKVIKLFILLKQLVAPSRSIE